MQRHAGLHGDRRQAVPHDVVHVVRGAQPFLQRLLPVRLGPRYTGRAALQLHDRADRPRCEPADHAPLGRRRHERRPLRPVDDVGDDEDGSTHRARDQRRPDRAMGTDRIRADGHGEQDRPVRQPDRQMGGDGRRGHAQRHERRHPARDDGRDCHADQGERERPTGTDRPADRPVVRPRHHGAERGGQRDVSQERPGGEPGGGHGTTVRRRSGRARQRTDVVRVRTRW
ncbi:hypothetical protein [Pseudonocardia humida]|uniref:hypothetical protein n=1 Tax=Pseudonocardia humida TaxID=2800819 RepID=UPI00207D03FC|nr:hypothetical protein [Pseudonocardia humida]